MIKQYLINFSSHQMTKNSGRQFVLLTFFCKFCLLVILDQYLLNINDILYIYICYICNLVIAAEL